MRLELPVADSIKQHNIYGVETNDMSSDVMIWLSKNKNDSNFICF